MSPRKGLLAAGLFLAGAWLAPVPGRARTAAETGTAAVQEASADTITGDTARADELADTLSAAGDTAVPPPDTAARLRGFPRLPAGEASFAVRRFECERSCLLDYNALVLLDVLEREMPGLTMLRGSYFTGPHHVLTGAAGPGFTEVRLEGRPLPSLAGGQVELARIPVARLDRIQVSETPAGLVLEAAPVRREEPRAYSRIGAATGSPDVNRIHALFTNGLGRHLEVTTGIDLLNTAGQGTGGDRFDFWGSMAWLPGDGDAGVELQWRNQSLDRRGLDTASVDRRELHLVGRGRLGDEIWLTVTAGNSRRERSASGGDEAGGGEAGGGEARVTEVDVASLDLRAGSDGRRVTAGVEARDGPGQPSLRGRLAGGFPVLQDVRLSGGVSASRWEEFEGWSVQAGLVYRPDLGVDLEVGAGAATGVRGVPRPLEERADSLTFSQAQGRASAKLGPVTVALRGQFQDVSRRLPFGGSVDAALSPGPGVTIGSLEGTLDAPLVPLGWLLGGDVEPIRLVGTWRHQEVLEETEAASPDTAGGVPVPAELYLPAEQGRVAALFHDQFFQGDLEVRAELAARHRSTMTSFAPSDGTTGTVSGWTTADWNLMLKIKDVRIWWRVDNTRSAPWEDLVGVIRPLRRNIFGVKWEFYN